MSRRLRDPLELVSLRQLRYFNAAMQSHSFNEAARACSISQPALSEQIAALEAALGLRLFERIGRRALPTQEASQLHRQLTASMSDLQAALRTASDRSIDISGAVRIGLVQSYGRCWVAPVIRAAQEQWPDLTVSLSRRTAPELAEGVARGDLDFAVSFDPSVRSDMEIQSCFNEPFVAVRQAKHRRLISLGQLADDKLALLPAAYAMRRKIDNLFSMQGLRSQVHFESDNLEDLVYAALDGKLTAIVNAVTAMNLDVPSVSKIDAATLVRNACLIRARHRYHSRAAILIWNNLIAAAVDLQIQLDAYLKIDRRA